MNLGVAGWLGALLDSGFGLLMMSYVDAIKGLLAT